MAIQNKDNSSEPLLWLGAGHFQKVLSASSLLSGWNVYTMAGAALWDHEV